jgi:predicted MFS family arabinose efflux permease
MEVDERARDAQEELDEQAAIASSSVGSPLKVAPAADATPQTDEQPPADLPPIWRNRDYMLLWSGQVVSALGSGMSGIVTPLLVLFITEGSATAAGIGGALGTLPYLLFSLPVGALIDRLDRKKVMITCDLGQAAFFASVVIALYLNVLTVWHLYLNAFAVGTLHVFFNLAEVAALPRVVPKKQLPQASAQNEAGLIGAFLAGPPLGTILYQHVGRAFPFLFDAVTYLISAFSLTFIKTRFQEEKEIKERHIGREIGEGLAWLWNHSLIRFMAMLTGAINFVNAPSGLILIVLAKELGADDAQVGWMFSIGAAGGIIGSILGGQIQKRFSFGQVIIGTGWLSVMAYPLYAVAPNFLVLGIITAVLYSLSPIYNVVQFSYRLALIPDRLQGRVNSVFRLLAYGSQPLGAALAGVLLDNIGTLNTIFVFGGWLAFFAVLTTLNSHVRNARPIEQVAAES